MGNLTNCPKKFVLGAMKEIAELAFDAGVERQTYMFEAPDKQTFLNNLFNKQL